MSDQFLLTEAQLRRIEPSPSRHVAFRAWTTRGQRDIRHSRTGSFAGPAWVNRVFANLAAESASVTLGRCEGLINREEKTTMSVNEIQALAQKFADAFDRRDIKTVLDMLSDDVEVFDTVPYRFDGRPLFAKFLNEAFEGIASTSFGFRQPSCRVYNDTVGIVNAYDMFRGATKDGKPIAADGRTTLIFVKQGTQWKIVSCHFSHMPHTP